ncbi:MAG TPA: Na+/H+ antiporter NhaC [Peptococcaceae bacterium]|nr:Na+/H+ antiporter NhaC [Peptococcaceae bacterium]
MDRKGVSTMLNDKNIQKAKAPRKVNFTEAMILLLVIVSVMIWTALIAKAPTAMGVLYCAIICAVYGMILGNRWDDMFVNVLDVVKTAMPALYFLMLVGFVSAAWIASGTIPYMIYLGLKIIHPSIFLFATFLMTAIASLVTGSSWAIVTSIGLALGGIATGLGIPLPMAAGAIVSGCFLGDKWSPLSDTPNLSAASTGQNIIKLFKSMIPTSGYGAILAAVAFLVMGFMLPVSVNADTSLVNQLTGGLAANFNFNLLLLLPVVFVFVMAALKFSILPVLSMGVGIGMLEAMIFQGKTFKALTGIVWSGYVSKTDIKVIDSLLSRGGAMSIAGLVMLLFAAFTFAGLIEKIGVLDAIMEQLLKVIKSRSSLIVCTLATSIATVFLSSSVYVSIILNGRMYDKAYRKMDLDIINLSRTITEGSAYFGGMCPWSGGALLVISSLGVAPWVYLPYVFGCWGAIFFTVLWAYTGKFMPGAEYNEDGKLISMETEAQAA